MQRADNQRRTLLENAATRLTLPQGLDATARVARHNLLYGLGRVLHALNEISPQATAHFYGTPDLTITRTPIRWGSGFAYGGALEIQNLHQPVVFPELRPNTCGTITGKLLSPMTSEAFIKRAAKVRFNTDQLQWDYGRRNHFVNLYESTLDHSQIFIIHGCPASIKPDSEKGPGLSLELSPYWQAKIQTLRTPLGKIAVLCDDAAVAYWETYQQAERFSKRHRAETAAAIFGDYDLVANETHEGMHRLDLYLKGCHAVTETDVTLPILTQLGQPVYLASPPSQRNQPLPQPAGILALLPHGTGYSIEGTQDLSPVFEHHAGHPLYLFPHPKGHRVFADFCHVPFSHRAASLVRKWEESGHFATVDELTPLVSLKL